MLWKLTSASPFNYVTVFNLATLMCAVDDETDAKTSEEPRATTGRHDNASVPPGGERR